MGRAGPRGLHNQNYISIGLYMYSTMSLYTPLYYYIVGMDVTSIALGKRVRDDLAEYRDVHDHPNYNEAIKDLLSKASETEDLEMASA